MSAFCILLAAPRSGTTLLGDAIARSFAAAWPQEIFNEAFADPALDYRRAPDIKHRTNFFNYRHEKLRKHPRLSYPSTHNQSFLFRAYIDHLVELEQAERFLIDIKYTSWHHLDGYWHLPYSRPGLVEIIRELGLPIVHLRRRNLFALYCSQAYAEATGVWATLDDLSNEQTIVIDMTRCRKHMAEIEMVSELFRRWLSDHPIFELEYETLLNGAEWSEHVSDTFSQIYGVTLSAPLTTKYRKVTPPLGKIVRNAEEVLASLRGTPFQCMAEEALCGS